MANPRLSLAQIFLVFFRAGWGFGGGLAVLAMLEEELVTRRRIMSRSDLITLWSIGRIVPCGTMTAVAVAIGYRLGRFPGSVAALVAAVWFRINPTLLLFGGGVIGALFLRGPAKGPT